MLTLPELDALLQRGGVMLLPNQHGARLWQQNVGEWRCRQRGVLVVEAAHIHAVDLWLAELWQTLTLHCSHPVLANRILSAAEETLLWQRVLAESRLASTLLNPGGTAKQLREAQRLLNFWQISLPRLRQHLPAGAPDDSEQDQVLAWRWLQDFRNLCERQHCLPQSALLPGLLQVLKDEAGMVKNLLPAEVLWLDFDDPPPLYQELQQTLQDLGVQVVKQHFTEAAPTVSVHVLADTAAEIRAAAQWARAVLDAQPEARVGIVCPNLQSLRPQLLRIFHQQVPATDLFCSAAATLADHSFTALALQLLTLHTHSFDSLQLCRLLRSPWLQSAGAEADARAMLEWRIRRQGELQITLADVREWCLQQDKPWYSPVLGHGLQQCALALRRRQAKPMTQWLEDFQTAWRALLDLDALASETLQTLRRAWELWLDDCRRFAVAQGAMSREQAQAALLAFAQHWRVTEGNPAARIHLLAPVETAGLRFTHVHVLQMQAGTWPSESQPNPCLPWQLQRECQMPAVDPNRELARARLQIIRLQHNTEVALRFSYPAQVDDLPVLPNPLLPAIAVSNETAATMPAALHPAIAKFSNSDLITVTEITHLPLPQEHSYQAAATLLDAQALCPFRAFALYRLHSQELPRVSYGLPASVAGELVHKIMQSFWRTLRQSSLLTTLGDEAIERHLRDAIADPLREFARKYPHTLTPRLLELEEQRVLALLKGWLEHEKQRAPFTVATTEQELQWHYANLQLKLRIDRVDVTANGRVVVDYKTGQLNTSWWQQQRPEQPQLLLYQQALHDSGHAPVAGMLYAKVTLEKMGYSGITAMEEGPAALALQSHKHIEAESWEALQQYWQQSLQALAQEYLDGLTIVAPQFRRSCDYCHLESLCRVAEAHREDDDA